MKKLVLSCEYLTPPLFINEERDEVLLKLGLRPIVSSGPISVSELSISSELKKEIIEWDKMYQSTFNILDPDNSDFDSIDLKKKHINEGFVLAEKIKNEIGENFEVEYIPLSF